MQKRTAVAFGSLVALVLATAPALAKNPNAQKTVDEKSALPSCHSYVQNPDGSWAPIPCQEVGMPPQTQHRAPARNEDDAPR